MRVSGIQGEVDFSGDPLVADLGQESGDETKEGGFVGKEGGADGGHKGGTTAANTTKGEAEGSDWRARNEMPEPTIEA